ncbi:hypothetical protein L2E82_37512 [Cichorium intybus]|uniref:Uncharacterized protein n=1 Tax=Cichorium intybus TaxID=13427 RepID=A0ACB9ADP5_CICIN|nr:hypothetical protein L2E82_37512 [Cichorium intybus]
MGKEKDEACKFEALVLFKEIGHSLNPANSLVLSASPSAYSVNPNSNISSPPSLSGSSISLVSVVQARNNARIVFSGSLDLFSNKFFKSPVQKAGSSNKYEKSGKIYFKQGGVEMSMPQGSFENLPIPKKRLSRKEDIIMVDDRAKLAKAFSQSIRVLLYGGVGPLPSDVSIAGVAKAFGVRLIKCENVIVLSATNVNEFDQQWECLIRSRLLATIGSFVSKHFTTSLSDLEVAQPLSKLSLEFPNVHIGRNSFRNMKDVTDEEMIEAAMEPISTKLSSK